jgi:hypothetical protein
MSMGNKYFGKVLAFGKSAASDKVIAYAAIGLGVMLVVYFLLGSLGGDKKKGAKKGKAAPAKANGRSSTPSKRSSRSKSPAPAPSPEAEGVKRSARLRSRTPKKK